ncbi:MAG: hypothetical protein ACOCRX_04280 [Candidatus Woesearchaeota archaeon]
MKKIIFLSLTIILFTSFSVSAQNSSLFNLVLVGEVSYNIYDGFYRDDNTSSYDEYDIGSGFGVRAGGQYWFDKELALETGVDMANIRGDKSSLFGPYGFLVHKAVDFLSIKGGFAYYFLDFINEASYGHSLGYLYGGNYHYSLTKNTDFTLSTYYRSSLVDMKKKYGNDIDASLNMSGLSFSAGINFKF